MNHILKFSLVMISLSLAACNNDHTDAPAGMARPPIVDASLYFQTKTPYQPQQQLDSYEVAPTGFHPVFMQLVARHGSRGLSSMKYDLALYNLWLQAKQENALTPLGEQLGADLEAMMKANILLGDGVEGIRQRGYGNETSVGIKEHRGIADRLLQRLPQLFSNNSLTGKSIQVVSSGVDRAVDSARFFSNELLTQRPDLKTMISPASYQQLDASSVPTIADGGVNRFNLYFHSLNQAEDQPNIITAMDQSVYEASLAYQDFEENNTDLADKLQQLNNDSRAQQVATEILTPLFQPAFLQKIGQPDYRFSNRGSYTVTAANGEKITETGKGKNTIASMVDAAAYLYELYSITGGMQDELGATDFKKYMPADAAEFYAQFNDASDFYSKGPGFDTARQITTAIAQGLKQDLFSQVDDVMDHRQPHIAVLRFAHAEIMIPLATSLDLNDKMQSLPLSQTFNYENSQWRGEEVSPMAANLQWDIYQNDQGRTLVKMLYNEKETGFKKACDAARYQPGSFYYDYLKLKQCYDVQ
ncbi:histidine-type phosphatase [Acinetobacter sp. WZC-1]|uniref:histidine-type phosphatase n=1 Tax=Acinetobacter sp. WZC-1 TaxID=3459034 RepID=UPI00403DB352